MSRKFFVLSLVVMTVLSIALVGCKGKAEKVVEEPRFETTEAQMQSEAMIAGQAQNVVEPAQTVATETIPPTAAAPTVTENAAAVATQMAQSRSKDIQKALKNAGFYTGAIDGKVGPRTKKAIIEFQKAKGLKADGKVGPKTWAELEKYLMQ